MHVKGQPLFSTHGWEPTSAQLAELTRRLPMGGGRHPNPMLFKSRLCSRWNGVRLRKRNASALSTSYDYSRLSLNTEEKSVIFLKVTYNFLNFQHLPPLVVLTKFEPQRPETRAPRSTVDGRQSCTESRRRGRDRRARRAEGSAGGSLHSAGEKTLPAAPAGPQLGLFGAGRIESRSECHESHRNYTDFQSLRSLFLWFN